MSHKTKAIKGTFWSVLEIFGGQSISLLVFLVLTRLLDPESFGLVAMAVVFIAVLEVFLEQGYGEAIIQRSELSPKHLDTAFWVYFATGLLLFLAAFFAAPYIAQLYREPKLDAVLKWLSLILLFQSFNGVQISLLRRELNFKSLTKRTLAARSVGGVVGVVMAFNDYGVWSLVAQRVIGFAVMTLVLWKVSSWRPGLRFSTTHFRDLVAFGLPVMGSHMLAVITKRTDDFLIGYYLGPVALGIYTVAFRLVMMANKLLNGTVNKVALPVFSKLQNDLEKLTQAFYYASRMTSSLAFPVFLLMFAVVDTLIPAMFGEKWTASIPVMQPLIIYATVQAVTRYNGVLLVSIGRPGLKLRLQIVETVLSVVGFFIAVNWGIVAVAIARLCSNLAVMPLWLVVTRRYVGYRIAILFRQIMAPLLISLAAMAVSMYLMDITANYLNMYLNLLATGIIFAVVYFVLMGLFGREILAAYRDIYQRIRS